MMIRRLNLKWIDWTCFSVRTESFEFWTLSRTNSPSLNKEIVCKSVCQKSSERQEDLMELILVVTLSLCWWTAAARPTWSNKPGIIVSSDEIEDGGAVRVTCIVPIDYTGGDCRLYRENARTPFRVITTTDYLCVFQLTSRQLLGKHLEGSRVYLKCDYRLQQYTSEFSDIRGVTVWGSRPSPTLTVRSRFVSPQDSVEVTCSPPAPYASSSCHFFRDQVTVARGPCGRNLTGRQLTVWQRSDVLLPVNLTCRYFPERHRSIRSEPSNRNTLFVVDVSQVSSSVHCKVPVEDDQIAAFKDGIWMFLGAGGPAVTIQVTNSQLAPNETCDHRL